MKNIYKLILLLTLTPTIGFTATNNPLVLSCANTDNAYYILQAKNNQYLIVSYDLNAADGEFYYGLNGVKAVDTELNCQFGQSNILASCKNSEEEFIFQGNRNQVELFSKRTNAVLASGLICHQNR